MHEALAFFACRHPNDFGIRARDTGVRTPWHISPVQFVSRVQVYAERVILIFGCSVSCVANDENQVITCECPNKEFWSTSALCQHLESEACECTWDGEYVLEEFVDMLRELRWMRKGRRGGLVMDFGQMVERWGQGERRRWRRCAGRIVEGL